MKQWDLADLQYAPEGQFLDRKRASIAPQRVAQYLSAFANTLGGTLVLGVEDDGTITGFKFPGSVSQATYLAVPATYLREQPEYQVERIPCVNFRGESDELLVFQVAPYPEGLVTLLEGSGYLWVNDETRKLTLTLLGELKQRWEKRESEREKRDVEMREES